MRGDSFDIDNAVLSRLARVPGAPAAPASSAGPEATAAPAAARPTVIGGFETPLSGSIKVDGRDITHLPPAERPVTSLFQGLRYYNGSAYGSLGPVVAVSKIFISAEFASTWPIVPSRRPAAEGS